MKEKVRSDFFGDGYHSFKTYSIYRSLKSGVYKISFGSMEVPVFCQMSDFGCGAGGWTPVMKINGTKVHLFLRFTPLERFSFAWS